MGWRLETEPIFWPHCWDLTCRAFPIQTQPGRDGDTKGNIEKLVEKHSQAGRRSIPGLPEWFGLGECRIPIIIHLVWCPMTQETPLQLQRHSMVFTAFQSRPPACSHPHCPLDATQQSTHLGASHQAKTHHKAAAGQDESPGPQPLPWLQNWISSKISFRRKEQDLPQSSM